MSRRLSMYDRTIKCERCSTSWVHESPRGGPLPRFCPPCRPLRQKERQRALAPKYRTPEARRRQRYGLIPERYDEMLAAQDGRCAICHDGPAEHVDHDHTTFAVRALLCQGCNQGLGLFREDPERLAAAIDYLKEHSCP